MACVQIGANGADSSPHQCGFPREEQVEIFRVVSGVLQLGIIQFRDLRGQRGGSRLDVDASTLELESAARQLGLLSHELEQRLLARKLTTTGTAIEVQLRGSEAAAARDALAKSLYSKLFDHVVARVNQCFPYTVRGARRPPGRVRRALLTCRR